MFDTSAAKNNNVQILVYYTIEKENIIKKTNRFWRAAAQKCKQYWVRGSMRMRTKGTKSSVSLATSLIALIKTSIEFM